VTALYVGLHTSSDAEIDAPGYARQPFVGGPEGNSERILFPPCGHQLVTHAGLYTAVSGGSPHVVVALNKPERLTEKDQLAFYPGQFVIGAKAEMP
jgi:hypothetical protein